MAIPQKPNIILILTDHFRRDAITPKVTPNLWKMREEGVCFDNAYTASPLCQPARNCLITGLLPHQTGIAGNMQPPIGDAMRADTFMVHLKSAGYHTALVGKHHYIDRYGIGMDVLQDDEAIKAYGFDEVVQVLDDGENVHNDDAYTHWLKKRGELEAFRKACRDDANNCGAHPFEPDETAKGFIGTGGIEFVKKYRKKKPFYLNLSFIGPHPPYWHPGECAFEAEELDAPRSAELTPREIEFRQHYLQKCSLIDSYVGKLINALKNTKQLKNTVLLFSSDHGDCLGDYGVWNKRFFYECSAGVPLIAWGAGVQGTTRMEGPHRSKALVSHLDLYPTILSLTGAQPSHKYPRIGRDLTPILEGDSIAPHNAVFSELATCAMIRTAGWKLVYDAEAGGPVQLFNMLTDPREERNLAGDPAYTNITLELTQRLLNLRIRLSQKNHTKEEQVLQAVRAAPDY